MQKLVKITDTKHALSGRILPGGCIYYDIHHTGDGPDLFRVIDGDKSYRLLSTQIDVDNYYAKELAKVVAKLGANVGDTVIIQRGGSGSFCAGWDSTKPHTITKISNTGNVEFDGGVRTGASLFRPTVIPESFYSVVDFVV